ncbi:hypothetical protein DYB32_007291 [Aphanomyces invadans]|uniref:Uncharacterized protein n=1 Tax=Aphanomyces invadans TaxID=157072 RepID=A0A3R6Z0L7_9STRA|nr:hypothetical protein DYB32_007291 [Aphanomyces invadans]
MSTDLYRIRIVRVDGVRRIVIFRVYNVYYVGSHSLPQHPSFFVLLLTDPLTYIGAGGASFAVLESPFNEAVTLCQALSRAWMTKHSHEYVVRMQIQSYRPCTIPEVVAGQDMFVYSRSPDEDKLEQAEYEVEFTDAKWMEHFKEGHVWQTTSFDVL